MLEKLLSKIEQYNPYADLDLIIKAYRFAELSHEGQFRNSGEKFFIHPVNVAIILTELNMDTATIIAGLLHDSIEDTPVTHEDISERFGIEIADLVEGVTKLKKLQYMTKQENQAENLRKMVLAMAKDIRVIIVKLADRLHNMRTLEYMSDEKRKEKAVETLEIYAPLAHRLGISKIKWELEDLSLRYLDPDNYYDLVERVSKRRGEREEYIESIIATLKEKLDGVDIENDISGRPKNFYSIYKKMVYEKKAFEQIFDLTAIRVIVEDIKNCYEVLGIVHSLWKPIPGRFKDYIAMPKPNMYQSIHTTVIGPRGETFEVQIRSWEMHKTAEFGIAAHWRYKEGSTKADNFDEKLTWLRQLLEWQSDLNDPKDFMETLKIDFFTDEVFVFTPRGDVINLPEGSTPIDFAYRVHSEVGDKCVGAKVDGRMVPLNHKLQNGNIVEVITSKNSGPSRDWLKIVKSTQARNKIRQYFKIKEKDVNIIRGREMLEKEVKRLGYKASELLKEDWLKSVVSKMSMSSVEDLYSALGYGSVSLSQVIPKIRNIYNKENDITDEKILEEEKSRQSQVKKEKSKFSQGVNIKGLDNIKIRFAKCCNPVPGDKIIGFITKGRGVAVHRTDCPNISSSENTERFIEVQWDNGKDASYPAEIQVKASDRFGLLSEITKQITEADIGLMGLNARTDDKDKTAIINLTLEIKDIEDLRNLMKKIKRIESIIDVYRVTS